MTPELDTLLRGIEELPCSYSRARMIQLLRGMAGRSGVKICVASRVLRGPYERALAAQLLESLTRAEASAALVQRLNCSRAHAYNLLKHALADRASRRDPHSQETAHAD